MSCRSEPKSWLLPNDILFNWPVSSSVVPKPEESMRPPNCKAKVRKVQKLTFLCEKYDPVWMRRFLKKSGSGYEAKPKRESRNVPSSPSVPYVSMVRPKPKRRCVMKPRRSPSCPPPKFDKPKETPPKVKFINTIVTFYNI